MKTKLTIIMCAVILCAYYSWAATEGCGKPTPTDVCSGNQDAMCSNGCTKITGDGTKNQDCQGTGENVVCSNNASGGSAGITKYTYQMLDGNGAATDKDGCKSCGTTLLSGPTGDTVTCRTASQGTDPCNL